MSNIWDELAFQAWKEYFKVKGLYKTAVGAALQTFDGQIFSGRNIEHKFRCHDIHAEVVAIVNMVSSVASPSIIKSITVSERNTPSFFSCGSCLDWIIQYSSPLTEVAYQVNPKGEIKVKNLDKLMPFYPM